MKYTCVLRISLSIDFQLCKSIELTMQTAFVINSSHTNTCITSHLTQTHTWELPEIRDKKTFRISLSTFSEIDHRRIRVQRYELRESQIHLGTHNENKRNEKEQYKLKHLLVVAFRSDSIFICHILWFASFFFIFVLLSLANCLYLIDVERRKLTQTALRTN